MKSTLTECLKKAGEIQKKNFQNIESFKLKEKISSIVTEVDFQCDRVIIETISKNYPDHNILTEENGFIDKQSDLTWVVDPLDGTSNYVAGLSWFGVLISILENNVPVMSGAYLPIEEKLYFAEKGKGSFLNEKKLTVRDSKLENSLVAFSTDYTADTEYLEMGIDIYKMLVTKSRNVRATNCLVDLLNVPENKFGGCINLFSGIWDIAAPYLIIKEAGGVIKDLQGNDILFKPNAEMLNENYPIIAGTNSVVKSIMNRFQ